MKVRIQLMLILLSVLVSLASLSLWLKYKINHDTRNLLLQKLVETKEKDVTEILERNTARISGYTYYYSGWEKLVDFLTVKKDTAWAKEVLDNELSIPEIDYIWVADEQGRPYYNSTTKSGLEATRLTIIPSVLTKELGDKRYNSFFIKHNNNLVEVFSGQVLLATDEKAKPRGYLMLGHIVDSAYISSLRSPSEDINFKLDESLRHMEADVDPGTGSLQFGLPLSTITGEPIAALKISRSYPFLNSYQTYLKSYLVGFLTIVIFIGALFYLFSKVILIGPLSLLSTALHEQNAEKLLRYNKRKNEFGDLSRLITDFFLQNKKLQAEIETRKRSEQELYTALKEKEAAQTEKAKAEDFLGQQQAILKLNNSINHLEFDDILKETIAHGAKTINCERVGIWLYDEDNASISANYVYRLSSGSYTDGGRIFENSYPNYFKHFKRNILIVADDAFVHPAYSEFATGYLAPLGITSIMGVPIRSAGKIIGIVRFEHIGPKREWMVSEQVFARSIADIIAITSERRERSYIEAELKKSQARFEETQELAHIGNWELNFHSKEIIWSKEMYRIFELSELESGSLGKAYRKNIHTNDLPVIQKTIRKLIRTKGRDSVELRIVSRNGAIKYILAIGEAFNDRNGMILGMRGTVQDITKQKQAAMAKSDFLSCMSHEIRTPINGVVGIANLLMEEDLNKKQKEYVQTLNFSAQHLATVVSDILDFSKIESGHMVFEKVSFNLEKNCRYVFNLFANKAAEKNIAFNFSPTPLKAYSLYGDYVRLNQVISNLLSNAIKFTNKGRIDFSYSIEDDSGDKVRIIFSVKDTGIGIPEENQKHIFESFTQADETITRQYGGTGLGLTICKKLVELQGGTIGLKSTFGKGSEFIVELPFDKHVYKKDALPTITTAEKNQTKGLNGMKILVAEDNNINAMVLTRFLTKWNIESKVATDGSQALEMLKRETFDIVLMDIQMPNLDGIEATKIIRQSPDENVKNILVVAFTADASVDNHRELLKIGFDHCMTKPFNPDTLFSFLKKNYNAA
jgi:signal transduction histidine kinase/ActR/RegA family two-component response regulator/sensor domain CHASE-containing protein